MNRFWERFSEVQFRHAGKIVIAALLLGVASIPLIWGLGLNSDWTALLPEHAPSVQDLEAAQGRVEGLRTLTIAIESPSRNLEGMQKAARAIQTRLEASESEWIRAVDWSVAEHRGFVHEHRHLYVGRGALREIRDATQRALNDGSEPNAALVERITSALAEPEDDFDEFPDGFFVSEDRSLLVLFVRTERTENPFGHRALVEEVLAIVADAEITQWGDDLSVNLAGDAMVELEEKEAVARELFVATGVTVVFVSMAILVFFRRMRAIALLFAAILTPVAVTFAVAGSFVDELNTSTMFLASIVLGNGINPNIIWLSGYFEQRRAGRGILDAVKATHRRVWVGTLTASLAAGLAYASLVLTDFRGFRDFGIIGGFGMGACWFGATSLLPAWIVLLERAAPLKFGFNAGAGKSAVSVACARLVRTHPLRVVMVSMALTFVAVGFVGSAISEDPLEYDFRRLTSDRQGHGTALALNERVDALMGTSHGMVLVVEQLSDVAPLERELERQAHQAGTDALWQFRVRSLSDLVPAHQEEKAALWYEVRAGLQTLAQRTPEDAALLARALPPDDIASFGMDGLPESVARPFTETDGSRGHILIVDPTHSVADGRYLIEWSDAVRLTRTESGSHTAIASVGTVFADVIDTVLRDAPRAMVIALLATLLLCIFAFRTVRERFLTVTALLLGITWMAGSLAAMGIRLNFLNFVAFPISFGNGADYGLNVMHRYETERRQGNTDAVVAAIERAGGAVSLCSLTTIIGYTSLYFSANHAINSFGLAMAVSEVTCLVSAMLTMPAILMLLARRDGTVS